MKRMGKLLCCLAMALTVLWNLPVKQVKADGEEFTMEGFEMKVTQQEDVVTLDVTTTKASHGLGSITTHWTKKDGSDEAKEYIVSMELNSVGDSTYQGSAQVYLSDEQQSQGFTEGMYTLSKVEVSAANEGLNTIMYSKQCDEDTNGDEGCSVVGSPLSDKWDNYSIELKNDTIEKLPAPELTEVAMSDEHELTLPMDLPVSLTIGNQEDYTSTYTKFLFDDGTGKLRTVDYNNDAHMLSLDKELRFYGENYELVAIVVEGDKENEDGTSKSAMSVYAFRSDEELRNKYGDDYGSIGTNFVHKDLSPFMTNAYTFHVKNYIKDDEAPVLKSFRWTSDPHVVLPGKVTFEVEYEDASDRVSIVLLSGDEEIGYAEATEHGNKVSDVISFHTFHSLDTIKITGIRLTDEVGNEVTYTVGSNNPELALSPVKDLTFERYLKYDEILHAGTDGYIDTLKAANDGAVFLVDTSASSKIPKEVFEAIQGKDVTVIFEVINSTSTQEMDTGVQYIFNGKDITNPKAIDVAVTTQAHNSKTTEGSTVAIGAPQNMTKEDNLRLLQDLKELPALAYYYNYLSQFDPEKEDFGKLLYAEEEKWEYLEIVFKPNGQLPGKARVRVTKDNNTANHLPDNDLKIYYQHADGSYELVGSNIDMEYDGRYEFSVDHNSTYVMTRMELAPEEETPKPDTPSTPEDNTTPEVPVTPDTETPKEEPKQPENGNTGETSITTHHENKQAEETKQKPSGSQKQVDTGDTTVTYWPYIMGLALLAGVVFVVKRKKENK